MVLYIRLDVKLSNVVLQPIAVTTRGQQTLQYAQKCWMEDGIGRMDKSLTMVNVHNFEMNTNMKFETYVQYLYRILIISTFPVLVQLKNKEL